MMKQPWPRFPQFSSFLSHWAHQTSQDVFVDVLINSLTLWQEFCEDNSMDIKKSDQHHLGFGLEHLAFLGLCDNALFHSRLEDLWLIASSNSFPQVGFSFELLRNVLTHFHSPLLLCFIQLYLGTIFAQIFRNDPPYPLANHILLICYHSDSKTAFAPHLLSHTRSIFIRSACGWPPTPVIIFHLLSSLFEPPVPLKKTTSWHRVITINFFKQF